MKEIVWSEYILLLAGLGILASVPLIFFLGGFEVWVAAKVLYGIGVVLFLFNR